MSAAAVWGGGAWTGISSCSCRLLPNHDFWNGAAWRVHNSYQLHDTTRHDTR
jgi:hypothetical protein